MKRTLDTIVGVFCDYPADQLRQDLQTAAAAVVAILLGSNALVYFA